MQQELHQSESLEALLPDLYADYCSHVSPANWALSYRASMWLWRAIERWNIRTAVDLGSGWSSLLLRLHPRLEWVASVDVNDDWARKTEKFLDRHGLPCSVLPWAVTKPTPAQLVIFDLGGEREKTLEQATEWVSSGGLLFVDDAHRPAYRAFVEGWARARGWSVTDLREQTADIYGRYAIAIGRH
jgi:hypothetical protein